MSVPPGCRIRVRRDDGELDDLPIEWVSREDFRSACPVRVFRSLRGQRHYSGWYWAATTGHHVVYESRLELARLLIADQDVQVTAVVGQPFLMQGQDGQRLRRHVPDFLLVMADGSLLVVDVKPYERLADPKVTAQFAWARAVFKSVGWRFEVWSGADPALLANLRWLAGYRRAERVDRLMCDEVMAGIHGPESLEQLQARVRVEASPDRSLAAILHLLWRGHLVADLSMPLTGRTVVARTERVVQPAV